MTSRFARCRGAADQGAPGNEAFRSRPDVKSRLETEWDAAVKAAYAKARELAEQAGRPR